MTKLCMIGNSHVASMRNAWGKIADQHPTLKVDIFAQHAKNLMGAELAETGHLRPGERPFWYYSADAEASRTRAVNLSRYDAFVVVGLEFGPVCTFRTYRKYHYFGLAGKRQQGLSREQFKRAVLQIMTESAAMHLATLIRSRSERPILFLNTPLPSENGYADLEKRNMELWRAAAQSGDGEALMTLHTEVCGDLATRGFTVVPQPEDTKASAISTLQRFAENAARTNSDEIRPDDDYLHMNDAYGVIMWRDTLAMLGKLGIATD